MGFINIPKRFLKIHKTSNAFNLWAVPLYTIACYNYVNMSVRSMRLSHKVWLKNYPRRQKLFQEKKAPRGACSNPEWACSSLRVWFPNAVREEAFRSNQPHHETLRFEQYQSLFLQSVSTGWHPSLRNAVHSHITSGLQSYCCPFAWVYEFLRNICAPSRLLRQQGLIVPRYLFNYFPSVRSDLSSEQSGNQKGS